MTICQKKTKSFKLRLNLDNSLLRLSRYISFNYIIKFYKKTGKVGINDTYIVRKGIFLKNKLKEVQIMNQYQEKDLNKLLEMISRVSNRLIELESDVDIKHRYELLANVAEIMKNESPQL